MSEITKSEIIYEEGWRETAPVIGEETPIDEEKAPEGAEPEIKGDKPDEKREASKPLLITIQLVLCLLAALVLFLLKAMDSEGYHSFMEFYRDELQKPVISREVFSAADMSGMLAEDNITIQATPDEAADS